MDIKSFSILLNEDGSFNFVDKNDKEAFVRTLSFLSKNKGIKKVDLVISTIDEKSTDKQINLFNILCRKIAIESGQYSYDHVRYSFLSYLGYNNVEDVTKEEFNELLNYSVTMANEVFNIKVRINPDNNHIELE